MYNIHIYILTIFIVCVLYTCIHKIQILEYHSVYRGFLSASSLVYAKLGTGEHIHRPGYIAGPWRFIGTGILLSSKRQ